MQLYTKRYDATIQTICSCIVTLALLTKKDGQTATGWHTMMMSFFFLFLMMNPFGSLPNLPFDEDRSSSREKSDSRRHCS